MTTLEATVAITARRPRPGDRLQESTDTRYTGVRIRTSGASSVGLRREWGRDHAAAGTAPLAVDPGGGTSMSQVPGVWTQTNYRILTVDDDPAVSELLKAELQVAGFEVWTATSGQEALGMLETRGLPHLAVIDIMMPGMNGIELSARLQEFIDLPIIMLTGVTDTRTVVDTIRRLAEDYVVKPFEATELVARVERLLRRIGDFSYALEPRIQVDDRLAVEFARQLVFVEGRAVELTPTETKLLYILMRNAGHTMLTEYLIRRLWPVEEVFEDALRTHVYRLRKKIEESPRRPRYVLTRRGFGYTFPKLS